MTSDGSQTYIWDLAGKLKEVKDDQDATIATMAYDPYGRRVTKGDQANVYHYYYNGWQVIEEYADDSQSTELMARNVWGLYMDELIVRTDIGAGDDLYPVANPQYSPLRHYDGNGDLAARVKYTPHGKAVLVDSSGTPITSTEMDYPILFTGQRHDVETGLDYFKERMWGSELGRFLSRDPLGLIEKYNTYSGYFVMGGLDPLGLMTFTPYKATGPDPMVSKIVKPPVVTGPISRLCELYCMMGGVTPLTTPGSKGAKAKAKMSAEVLMCLMWLESTFDPTKVSSDDAYGLGQTREGAAWDVDKYILNRKVGTTFKEVKAAAAKSEHTYDDIMDQVSAANLYLYRTVIWKGSLKEGLKQYGPRNVGYGYAEALLDCESCLKDSKALECCDCCQVNSESKGFSSAPTKAQSCFDQMNARIEALGDTTKGYRKNIPKGLTVPE